MEKMEEEKGRRADYLSFRFPVAAPSDVHAYVYVPCRARPELDHAPAQPSYVQRYLGTKTFEVTGLQFLKELGKRLEYWKKMPGSEKLI